MSIAEGTILKITQNIVLNDEQEAVNVFWAELQDNAGAGPLAEADVLVAASNWMDQLYANVDDDMADTIHGGLVEVWEVDTPTGDLTPVGDEATTWDGLSGLDALPNGVAAICSLRTTDTDVTGRKFIPGFVDDSFTDNNLDAPSLARLVLFALDWGTIFIDANDVEFVPGVYSGTKANFLAATGTIVANAIAGYQRRRKPGVGS